jgi:hypothetical protein
LINIKLAESEFKYNDDERFKQRKNSMLRLQLSEDFYVKQNRLFREKSRQIKQSCEKFKIQHTCAEPNS